MSEQDRDLLIRTVIGEAQGEDPVGQAAVAHVVLNRARSGKFGGQSVREVVLAPNQFEPWQTKRSALLAISKDSPIYQKTAQVVDQVLSGRIPDPTEGATHFLNADIVRQRRGDLPAWAVQMAHTAQKIGNHTFLGGGQKLAQTGANDAGPSVGALDRARAILGDRGPRVGGTTTRAAPAEGPTPQALERARALLGVKEEAPPRPRKSLTERAVQIGRGAVDTLTDVVTLGAGDELQALTGALAGEGGEGGFGDRFGRILEEGRGRRREFREENPIVAPVLEAGAGVATAATAGPRLVAEGARRLPSLFTPASTTTGRVAQAAGGGAAVGATTGFLSSEGGGLNRTAGAVAGAGLGGVLGAGGSAVVGLIQRVLEPLARSGKAIVNGRLTNEAQAALAQAGIDPNEASDVLARHFQERARRSGIGAETARRASADEFGVPLTRGQSTGDFDEIAFEEAARSGARGQGAGNVARAFEDQQREAIGDAAQNVVPGGRTAAEAGATVQSGLTEARRATKDWVDAGYAAIPRGTVIDVRAFDSLGENAKRALDDVTLNPSPHARAALTEIERLKSRAKPTKDAEIVGVDFLAVEQLRKRLNGISRRVSTSDAQAGFEIDTIRKSLDDWIDESVSNALISGDDAVIAAVKEARKRYGAFKQAFTPQGGGDDAGKAIEAMTDPRIRPDGITPQEIVNFLYGSQGVGARPLSVRVARRIKSILGKDSGEWQALRQGAWRKLVSPKEGRDIGAQALSNDILDFTKGNGSALAKELFSPDEIAKMNRFANVLRMTVPPRRATNPSGSGPALARTVQDTFDAVTTAVGVASGNIGTAFGSKLLTGILKSAGGRGRALANFNPAGQVATRIGPRQAATFGGGLLGGSLAGDLFSQ